MAGAHATAGPLRRARGPARPGRRSSRIVRFRRPGGAGFPPGLVRHRASGVLPSESRVVSPRETALFPEGLGTPPNFGRARSGRYSAAERERTRQHDQHVQERGGGAERLLPQRGGVGGPPGRPGRRASPEGRGTWRRVPTLVAIGLTPILGLVFLMFLPSSASPSRRRRRRSRSCGCSGPRRRPRRDGRPRLRSRRGAPHRKARRGEGDGRRKGPEASAERLDALEREIESKRK